MGVTPNLDQRGRVLRITAGAVVEAPGLFLLVLRFVGILSGDWPWFVGAILVALGWMLILEGLLGWCAVRALGPRE